MRQWEVVGEIYSLVSGKIKDVKYPGVEVSVTVRDLCQCMNDRTGQMHVVDGEQYEPPAMYEMCVAVSFEGGDIPNMLRAYGEAAVILKDDPELDVGEYAWHGSPSGLIYLEPVIRRTDSGRGGNSDGVPLLELVYRTEFGLNSQKAHGIKRVEKREIRGFVKK